MNSTRLLLSLVCAAACLALFSGCETEQAACEREKRLTERLDELQMDLDGKITNVNMEMASMRSNPPVVVQTVEAPAPEATTFADGTITINDEYSKAEELRMLAMQSRQNQLYEPAPPPVRSSSASGNIIRVPVPVRTIQSALREAGTYAGNIDGKAGPQTRNAITAFQRQEGIKADGIVGRTTWGRLQPYVPAGMSTTRLK